MAHFNNGIIGKYPLQEDKLPSWDCGDAGRDQEFLSSFGDVYEILNILILYFRFSSLFKEFLIHNMNVIFLASLYF